MKRTAIVWLLAILPATGDTSRRSSDVRETRWKRGDFVVATNDMVKTFEDDGDVVALQIRGIGESCALRRARHPMRLPCRVRYRLRWTETSDGLAYPSVNLVFDPPPLDDPWWKAPIAGVVGAGVWAGGLQGFVFHFPNPDRSWAWFGVSGKVEAAPHRHAFSTADDAWTWIQITLEEKTIVVSADGTEIARCDADLSRIRTFAVGFGDQHSTRVELDALEILRGR